MAGAFQASAFQNSAFQTDGSAAVQAGVKHKKRRTWAVRTPSGTQVFDSEAEANRFIGSEQRRLAALRKELAKAGVFAPKVTLKAVRADLEPDEYTPSAYLRVAPAPQFTVPQLDPRIAMEFLQRRDDEAALSAILEYL